MTQNQILTVGRATNRSSHGRLPDLSDLKTKAPRDASARVRRPIPGLAAAARLYVLVRLSVLNPERRAIFGGDLRFLGFWVFTSGVPVLSEAGTLILIRGPRDRSLPPSRTRQEPPM